MPTKGLPMRLVFGPKFIMKVFGKAGFCKVKNYFCGKNLFNEKIFDCIFSHAFAAFYEFLLCKPRYCR